MHFVKNFIQSSRKFRSLLINYRNMAFGPKKKHSKSRSRTRTTNWIKLTAKKLANRVMLNKEGNGLAHFIAEDGTYNGRQVLKTKTAKTTRV